jgi:formate dehydrogenase subunit gamma
MVAMQNILRLMLALCLAAFVVVSHAEEATPATDGMSSATPFAEEEGKTLGIKSDAQRKAESGESHYTQSRIRDAGVFQQEQGHKWRMLRNGPVTFYGGWLLMLVPAIILAFYLIFGPMKLHDAPTGKLIRRFSRKEQVIHWSVAGSFVVLGITGCIILFGKHVLIPVIGHDAFSWVAIIGKNIHNIVGPFFAVAVVAMFVTFVRDNLLKKIDLQWLLNVHLVVTGKKHVPSYKYNIGEKAWFWGGVSFMGLVVSVSGFVLDFPTMEQTRQTMQIANLVHGIGALLFMCAAFGHIYMGTIGAEGAYKAMKTGMVDETWAREHHELWYEQMKEKENA